VIPVGRLDAGSMTTMAKACLGTERLPATAQSFVTERAGGIPFLVEEMLASLLGDGLLVERNGSWQTTGPAVAGVPPTFAGAVDARLEAADPDSQQVICAAAVIGRRFDWALLSQLTGLPEEAVLAALRRGVSLQLIAADQDSFRFRHALTHEAVLTSGRGAAHQAGPGARRYLADRRARRGRRSERQPQPGRPHLLRVLHAAVRAARAGPAAGRGPRQPGRAGQDRGNRRCRGLQQVPPGGADPVQHRARSTPVARATLMKTGRRREAAGTGTRVLARPGAALVYQTHGTGPAVVLVHGFGLDMRMWDPQVAALAADFLVVRYDCRGFGATGPFDSAIPYTHADDLIALLDHLDISEAVLVGLSFGGRVTVQAALLAPARVRALVLLDAVLDGVPWDPESAAGLDDVARAVRLGGVLAGRAAWLAHPLFAVARQRPELAGQLAEMVSGYPGQHWLGQDPHREDRQPPIEALEELTMPALVVAGEHDVPGFLAMSDTLASRIPGARYHRVPAAGHLVNMEQPGLVTEVLTDFLTSGLAGR